MDFVTIQIGQSPYTKDIFPYWTLVFDYSVGKRRSSMIPSVEVMMLGAVRGQFDDHPLGFDDQFIRVMTHSHRLLGKGQAARAIRDLVITRREWRNDEISAYAFGNLAAELASIISSSLGSNVHITQLRWLG